ncbi:MAG: hypothetical protein PHR26_03410 [Candidatus ainarchaeum sp.]|nr:hypothetical protein [Candidatus ainarchaeum sp.]MDD3976030.1 hypothetical protein [Candidatus ainarchaeum sp.]
MSERIDFVSNVKGFTAVKKMNVDLTKKPEDILQFIVSIQVSTNSKIKSLLAEIVDVEKFIEENKALFDLDESVFLTEIYSAKTKKKITAVIPKEIDKNIKDAFVEAVQVYLLEDYFLKNNKVIAYHQILFPALKKLKKAIKG